MIFLFAFESAQEEIDFECESFAEHNPSNPVYKGHSGFVNLLADCAKNSRIPDCKCDIGIGGWSPRSERILKVDFVIPYIFDYFEVITRVSEVGDIAGDKFFFLKVFKPGVWLGILSVIVLLMIVLLLDRNFAPPRRDSDTNELDNASRWTRWRNWLLHWSPLFRLRHAVYYVLSHLLVQLAAGRQRIDRSMRNSVTRVSVLGLLAMIIGIFLVSVYTSSLTAKLFLTEKVSVFRNLESFKTCSIPPNRVCVPAGGAELAYWKQSIATSE